MTTFADVTVTDTYGDTVTVSLGAWEVPLPEVYLSVQGAQVREDLDVAVFAFSPVAATELAAALLAAAGIVGRRP